MSLSTPWGRAVAASALALTATTTLGVAPALAAPAPVAPASVSAPSSDAATFQARVVDVATTISDSDPVDTWRGGLIPYTWGGGHKIIPGPSYGTCDQYSGQIRPCPAEKTVGLDCSGLTRWVYALAANGRDVLGRGTTRDQIQRLTKVDTPQAGDLVFFGKKPGTPYHVGIVMGDGTMLNAPETSRVVMRSSIAQHPDLIGYYRLPAS